jgi:Mg2+ and Co2+ transporter CorA
MIRAALAVAVLVLVPLSAAAQTADCKNSETQLKQLDAAIAKLERTQMPQKLASDLVDVIDELIDGLKGTKKDLSKITESVNGAKDKLDDITKKLKDLQQPIPPAFSKLKDSLGTLAKGIKAGVEKYESSVPGKVAEGLDKAGKYIDTVVDQLGAIKDGIQQLQTFDNAANGTGADQVRALKMVFDKIKNESGAKDVPGVGQFLDAYSQALDGIATSVDSIEKSLKANLKMADEALQGTDFSPVDNLYPGLQTAREKLQAHLDALKTARAALAKQRSDDECDKPPPPEDPCKKGPERTAKDLVDRMTQKLRNDYEQAQAVLNSDMADLAAHGLAQPENTPSPEEDRLSALQGTLDLLRHAAAANDKSYFGRGDPLQGARDVASALGVSLPPASSNWRTSANAYIPLLNTALAQKTQAAHTKAQADYAAALKNWSSKNASLAANAKDAMQKRDAAKSALDKEVGSDLAKEASAKNWTKEQQDRFDACFPHEGNLRRSATHNQPNNCPNNGGLAGAMENEACQIGH